MEQLTIAEFKLMDEALSALNSRDFNRMMIKNMLGAMLPSDKSKEERSEEIGQDLDNDMKQLKKESEIIGERITLLKAKLIQMRTSAYVDAVCEGK